ncbi:MAG: class I SAM-dependent methyltransferase [Candidatus Diapherotrites archaeon]|uniref:Class I SAM-dependent methyltransferase n=1 Tax=Candidatus Iainarchaeum sp. TaxID=3101447 RepID=A0A8T3YKS2_9ARCH|nr:class I SAM-dependent methyltransferase [Candidatus Diapherotrites archaeon]
MHSPVDQKIYDKEYYLKINDGWREFGEGKLSPRFITAIRHTGVTDFSGKNILDIGFGRGELLVHLAKQGANCFGIDYSDASIRIAKKFAEENKASVDLRKMEVGAIKFGEKFFDAVFMLDVVEHLTDEELEKCFSRVSEILADGGVFVIHTMPNRFTALPFYFVSKVTNAKRGINEHVHINEQTPFSLGRKLIEKFDAKITMAHDRSYFKNTQFYAKHRARIKPFVDLFLTHDFSKIPVLNLALASEIWAVARKKNA